MRPTDRSAIGMQRGALPKVAAATFALLTNLAASAAELTAAAGGEWLFRALLDGKPIGSYRLE